MFLVVNIERWDIDRPMPRQVLTAPQGASVIPDLPNWAWHEYGMRVGFWRLKAALDAHGIAPTLAINGAVPAAYPRVTQACREAGWEFMVHGYHQMATHLVEDQRAMIREAIDTLREAGGHDPVGWLAPGLTETLETPDLLAEAGIRYCADWVIDDLPATHAHDARADADDAVQRGAERHPDHDDPAPSRRGTVSIAPSPSSTGCTRRRSSRVRRSWASPCIPISAACRTGSAGSNVRSPTWPARPGTVFWQGRQIMDWYLKATA